MAEYLNSWSDDWTYPVSPAEPSTDQMPTFESLKRIMRVFREKFNDRGPDVWVLTDEEYESLKKHAVEREELLLGESKGIGSITSVYGIRVEHYPTRLQVRLRCLELQKKGVKVGFLVNEEGK